MASNVPSLGGFPASMAPAMAIYPSLMLPGTGPMPAMPAMPQAGWMANPMLQTRFPNFLTAFPQIQGNGVNLQGLQWYNAQMLSSQAAAIAAQKAALSLSLLHQGTSQSKAESPQMLSSVSVSSTPCDSVQDETASHNSDEEPDTGGTPPKATLTSGLAQDSPPDQADHGTNRPSTAGGLQQEDTDPSFRPWRSTSSSKSSFKCQYCAKSFSQSGNFKRHLRTHTGEKPYQCRHCPKRFSQSGHRSVHERRHSGQKPHACSVCKKRFAEAGYLKVHMRRHTGEKPYSCRFCAKQFYQAGHLKVHERIHTGEKPYACEHCPKRFSRLEPLKIHQWVHNGEKPFACPQCPKRFTQRGNLKVHEKRHH